MRVCYCSLLFLTAFLCASSVVATEPIPTPTAIPPTLASPDIPWITKYNEARKQGTASELPVMLFVTMNRCRYCVKMQQDSFADESVAKELNESFVPAKLYLDPESKLAESLKITIYPTTMFIAPDGTEAKLNATEAQTDEFDDSLLDAAEDLKDFLT